MQTVNRLENGLEMIDEIKITSPQSLKKMIAQIQTDLSRNNLEVLFESGIFENGWSDIIDCCYYDYRIKRFKELICETYHGAGGRYCTVEIIKSELSIVFKKEWEFILYNYKAKIFILSSLKGGVGLYEVYYPLNIDQVKEYFKIGQNYLEELNRKIQINDKDLSKRYVQMK